MKFVGYKNLNDFQSKFNPMVIRHGYEDLNDVRMPDVMPATQVWLEMYPEQQKRYALLQAGVLELLGKDETPQQKAISALAAYNYGTQICTGLPALGEPDGPGASAKLDWLERELAEGNFADQKVVIFLKNIGSVSALHERLTRRGVGYETIWGRETRKEEREAAQRRFWEDPAQRVMIGTSAMERGLNLQIANILVFVESIPNPARMHQLLGRIRRAGSVHSHVFPFYLLMSDTQEERYLRVLGTRQALVDAVWNEDSAELFDRLSPDELLRLITP
jgi:SNF2 family DNA or RNA helicase